MGAGHWRPADETRRRPTASGVGVSRTDCQRIAQRSARGRASFARPAAQALRGRRARRRGLPSPERLAGAFAVSFGPEHAPLEQRQVFFVMSPGKDQLQRLAKTLKAEIDQQRIESYYGTQSLPFAGGEHKRSAVKIVDDRGVERLKLVNLDWAPRPGHNGGLEDRPPVSGVIGMSTAAGYPHIVVDAAGAARIDQTRYKVVHLAAEHYVHGWTAEELLRQHPDLRPEQAYAALVYFYDHYDAMVAQIEASAAAAEGARSAQTLSRAELLKRQASGAP